MTTLTQVPQQERAPKKRPSRGARGFGYAVAIVINVLLIFAIPHTSSSVTVAASAALPAVARCCGTLHTPVPVLLLILQRCSVPACKVLLP